METVISAFVGLIAFKGSYNIGCISAYSAYILWCRRLVRILC